MIVRVRYFSAELVQAVEVVENFYTGYVCVRSEVGYFHGDGWVFPERNDVGGIYDYRCNVAAYCFPCCICFRARANAPDRGWFCVPECAIGNS
jgi:hypothetical protein